MSTIYTRVKALNIQCFAPIAIEEYKTFLFRFSGLRFSYYCSINKSSILEMEITMFNMN